MQFTRAFSLSISSDELLAALVTAFPTSIELRELMGRKNPRFTVTDIKDAVAGSAGIQVSWQREVAEPESRVRPAGPALPSFAIRRE